MKITGRIVSFEEGEALTKHPDAILKSGELWVCSCGAMRLRMNTLKVNLSGAETEQASSSWCSECGDVARWEPSHIQD